MKRSKNIIAIGLILFVQLTSGCRGYYIEHNPQHALVTANMFVKSACVDRDIKSSMEFLDPQRSKESGEASIELFVKDLHKDGVYPTTTRVLGYEIIPGKPQINVYISGDSPQHPVYYCIVVIGDSSTKYFVSEIYKKNDPFEVSSIFKKIEYVEK